LRGSKLLEEVTLSKFLVGLKRVVDYNAFVSNPTARVS